MITLKRKISTKLNNRLVQEVPGLVPTHRINPVLEEAVKVFQLALKIDQPTVVILKRKVDMWADLTGASFYNSALGKISCHIYVHRHSTVLGTVILIAHEMVHAWQIATNQPSKKDWEHQAVELSLAMVEEFHVSKHPERDESLARAEVHMAWGWVH
jgi:hypothetical protein